MKVSPALQEEIATKINAKITFQEFDESLNAITNGGAPGPSGATANMVKAWSTPTRRIVYAHMENIWIARATPKWFKDKVIKLAPKIAGNPELNNMRPISLYEVLRKAWTTILGKRIHLVWHNNDVLHSKQYGYRLDKSTQMALFTVINEMEDAQHAKATKHITFWDIKRAFDSIPRNIQKLAWVRLGVPKDVAEWFVELDDGGLSFISSPFYHLNKDLHSPESMAGKNTHFSQAAHMAFEAQRSIGQGESASSLMWVALYDILLELIDPRNRHLHVAEKQLTYSDDDADKANPAAFADDLATITAGPNAEHMQQIQATWLSAFCAFTGLVIHPAKIKPTLLGPIPEKYNRLATIGPLPYDSKTDIIVHDLKWNAISCPLLPNLSTVKYLGVNLELRERNVNASYDATFLDINAHLSHLLIQPGSPDPKIDYILFKLMPIVLATATCANWTLKQYRTLDLPFSRAYRIILAFPMKAPDFILYMPQSEMGVGLPRFSDKAQVMKWEALTRCLAVGGAPARSMNDFFDRLPASTSTTVDFIRTLRPPMNEMNEVAWPNKRYTVRSLVEWFHQSGLSMCCTTQDPRTREEMPHFNESIADLAEDLRLWPSQSYSDEDNADLPPIRLVATDGSFSTKPRGAYDIITSESELRCCGTGGGGIVFIPPGYHESTSDPPLGVQLTLSHEAPGMNAFVWELAAQAVALEFTKYLPPEGLVLTSDCTSAIEINNRSLRTRHNQQGNVRGGYFATGAHRFADTLLPQQFIHTYGHPERSETRRTTPSLRDKSICMADAIAGGKDRATLGTKTFPMQHHEIKLDNVLSEIIPVGHWHLRTLGDVPYPVVGDVLPFQHKAQQKAYCQKRDQTNSEDRWTSTAFGFAHKVHPLPNRSYWAAGRRALIAFDWIGHGRNRAKPLHLSTAERETLSKCSICGQPDSQAHCMLACQHPPFHKLRTKARLDQGLAAADLISKTASKNMIHFIQQVVHASWTSSSSTSRIWLGLWNEQTLQSMLRQPLRAPMSLPNRQQYIKTVRILTAPLLEAYYGMLSIVTHLDHSTTAPSTATDEDPAVIPTPSYLSDILENTYTQHHPDNAPTPLHQIAHIPTFDSFTLSNAAFGHRNADGAV
jgi:hypothetical protein